MQLIFTNHALFRMRKRVILKQEVTDAIKYPDNTQKSHGKHFFTKKLERGAIEVCCEKTENIIKIITVYWL